MLWLYSELCIGDTMRDAALFFARAPHRRTTSLEFLSETDACGQRRKIWRKCSKKSYTRTESAPSVNGSRFRPFDMPTVCHVRTSNTLLGLEFPQQLEGQFPSPTLPLSEGDLGQ